MNFSYTMNRKDLKRMYIADYQRIDKVYVILITILFIFVTYDMLKYNIQIFIILYLILLFLLLLIFHLLNHIYASFLLKINDRKKGCYGHFEVKMDNCGITSTCDKTSLKIKWVDITQVKFLKNKIYIKYKNENHLIFLIHYDFLDDKSNFEKIKNFIKEQAKI